VQCCRSAWPIDRPPQPADISQATSTIGMLSISITSASLAPAAIPNVRWHSPPPAPPSCHKHPRRMEIERQKAQRRPQQRQRQQRHAVLPLAHHVHRQHALTMAAPLSPARPPVKK